MQRGEKILAISDTHFGDASQLLNDEETVEKFISMLSSRRELSEIILLGDILDLWVKTTVPALRCARAFIRRVSELESIKRITYVPGNHDHQMFMDAFRLEQDVRIMQGNLTTPRFQPARSYGETLLSALSSHGSKAQFSMVYPFVVREVTGRKVVFTHGHHLDFYASEFGWVKTFWFGRRVIKKRRKKATLHDIEMANVPFCGAMSSAPWVPELVSEALKYYHVITFFSKLFRSRRSQVSPLRDTLIRENYDEIQGLLPLLEITGASCFVFGHTHRPGMGRIQGSGLLVANTGAWTRGEDESIPAKTWVEIGASGDVELYEMKDGASSIVAKENLIEKHQNRRSDPPTERRRNGVPEQG
ncbi:MAG: metallophosphoesterase family protein [Actinomycetota bacterium]|nr:metallophosphoesterase family protein [Actinomycetota bacterium]